MTSLSPVGLHWFCWPVLDQRDDESDGVGQGVERSVLRGIGRGRGVSGEEERSSGHQDNEPDAGQSRPVSVADCRFLQQSPRLGDQGGSGAGVAGALFGEENPAGVFVVTGTPVLGRQLLIRPGAEAAGVAPQPAEELPG